MEIVLRGPLTDPPRVALTFDDGPGDWTTELLDVLAAADARATLFVLGEAVEGRADVVRRAVADGHELGNHTWSHRAAWRLSDTELHDELARTSSLLRDVAGVEPSFARPPYGRDYRRFARLAAALGMRTALWSIDPRDWAQPPAERIVWWVLRELHAGAVVDLHDGFRRGSTRTTSQPTVEAVRALLPELATRGYACVTLSELIASAAAQPAG
jgi:peptidoglycan/xylan/chitin deacetylase (PgdA/CDA1 family)